MNKNNDFYIYVCNISIISKSNIDDNTFLLTKKNVIIHFFNEFISIYNENSPYPLFIIKKYKIIEKKYFNDKNNILKELYIYDKINDKYYNIYFNEIYNNYNKIDINLNFSEKISKNKISENNIRDLIVDKIPLKYPNLKYIGREYSIGIGRIDLLYKDEINNIFHIFELKKKSTNIETINQVIKYGKYFEDTGYKVKLYVLGVKNGGSNKIYAKEKDVTILDINTFKNINFDN